MTVKFTKVRAGWYTLNVLKMDFRALGLTQLDLDVSRDDGTGWVVSYRTDSFLKTDRHNAVAFFDKVSEAKRFAAAVAEALKSDGDLPNPADFDEYAFLAYGYERGRDWDHLKLVLTENAEPKAA